MSKSSLSAGEVVRTILCTDNVVKTKVNKVYPVIETKAELPYIVYRRTGFSQDVKKGGYGADSITIEVLCYTAHYKESIELAEAVRNALDGVQYEPDNAGELTMRSCSLSDSMEDFQDDAYVQQLVFTIKI